MNKIPWNKPTYGDKRTIYRKLRDTDERRNKEMEGYSMLLGCKNQYGENDCITRSNLESESNIKLSVAFFTVLEQKITQFVWRHRRPPKAKVILRKKNRHYQRNANQNYNEGPSHTSLKGCYPKVYKQ